MSSSNGDLDNRFDYHAPDEDKKDKHETIRHEFKETARIVQALTPASREQSLALTHLEEGMFWANAALARHDADGERL